MFAACACVLEAVWGKTDHFWTGFRRFCTVPSRPQPRRHGLRPNRNAGPAGTSRAAAAAVRFVWVPLTGRDLAGREPEDRIPGSSCFAGQCEQPLDRFEPRIGPLDPRAAAQSVVTWHVSAHHFDIWSAPNRFIFWQNGPDWCRNLDFSAAPGTHPAAASAWHEIEAGYS